MTRTRAHRISGSRVASKLNESNSKRRSRGGKSTVANAVAVLNMAVAASTRPNGTSALTTSPYFAVSKRGASTKTSLFSKSAPRIVTPNKKKKEERTRSFEPMSAAKFPDLADKNISVHTLILGTHPSIRSLAEDQYYGHPQNAFWWIAGDCLGFRRSSGVSPSSGEPYKLSSSLRYGDSHIIPYNEQVRQLVAHGFALWDVIGSCQREGSLDSAIEDEVPNDIRGFCEQHPSIRRIILANGGTGSKYFVKYSKDWWESGALKPGPNKQSHTAFGRFAKVTNNFSDGKISCVSAVSVSPAAASYSYGQKRDFWETYVYKPGLEEFANSSKDNAGG